MVICVSLQIPFSKENLKKFAEGKNMCIKSKILTNTNIRCNSTNKDIRASLIADQLLQTCFTQLRVVKKC